MNKKGTKPPLPSLRSGRVHEISGPGALAFALLMTRGPSLMCGPPAALAALNADGFAPFSPPQDRLHALCPLAVEAAWAAEVALKSGALQAVLLLTPKTPNLTPFRRLQLAAAEGRTLGLILSQRAAPSSAAETRWHVEPIPPPEASQDSLCALHTALYKNRQGQVGSWSAHVRQHKNHLSLDAAYQGEPICPQRRAG